MNLFLFSLSVIGMTHIIVDSSIFSPIRGLFEKILPKYLYKILECYQCSGTWCGFALGWAIVDKDPFVVFACGCAGSFLSTLAATFLNYLEARSVVDIDLDEGDEGTV